MDPTLSPRRDPFGRSSDVDFADVFGGPPRRASFYDPRRRSLADSLGSPHSSSSRGLSGPGGEKPVFGGELSSPAGRRSHLGDDFFSDIFQSSDSGCSSPRRAERDSGGSFPPLSPGSRMLSPNRPAMNRGESVGGGASLPAQISLSMKLARGIDQPPFSSPTRRSFSRNDDRSLDTFSLPSSPAQTTARAVQSFDELRSDGHGPYRQSPLSRQVSHNSGKPLEDTGYSSPSMTSLDSYVKSGRYHFSLYKWAGKGVTLVMPSKSNENSKDSRRFGRLPEVVLHVDDMLHYGEDVSTGTKASGNQNETQDSNSVKDVFIDPKYNSNSKIGEGFSSSKFHTEFHHNGASGRSDTCNDNSEGAILHEVQEHELKNVSQLFDDDMDKRRNEDILRQIKPTKDLFKDLKNFSEDGHDEQRIERDNKINPVEVVTPNIQDVPVPVEDRMRGSKVKGKVKDFIKIFNPEVSPKRKGTFESLDRRSKGRDGGKSKVEARDSPSAAKVSEEVKTTNWNHRSLLDNPVPINQDLENTEEVISSMSYNVSMFDDSLSEMSDTLNTGSEPAPELFEASTCNIEVSQGEELEGCSVVLLSDDQNMNTETDSLQDQIKISDAKIREWSRGKEGNIRSLLSTLQYVLWPDSGWKPVPLVNIIEGPSVKRAYQKALLCLHPDKLQQKGAAAHQKHIAEKVFKILQDAWDHFNSITQF